MSDEKKAVEFEVDELDKELDDVAGGYCSGCDSCDGCAHGGCDGCTSCGQDQNY